MNIIQSATEALGITKVNTNGKTNRKDWFTDEVKSLPKQRKKRTSNI